MVTTLERPRTQAKVMEKQEARPLPYWQQQVAQIMGYPQGNDVRVDEDAFAREGLALIKRKRVSRQEQGAESYYQSGSALKKEFAHLMGYVA